MNGTYSGRVALSITELKFPFSNWQWPSSWLQFLHSLRFLQRAALLGLYCSTWIKSNIFHRGITMLQKKHCFMSLPTFSSPLVNHSAEVEKVLWGLNVHMPSSSFLLSAWAGSELRTVEEWGLATSLEKTPARGRVYICLWEPQYVPDSADRRWWPPNFISVWQTFVMFSSCVTWGTSVASWQLRGIISVGSSVKKGIAYPIWNKNTHAPNISHF